MPRKVRAVLGGRLPAQIERLNQLESLLEEFGSEVLAAGNIIRIAGGVLKRIVNKSRRYYDPKTKEYKMSRERVRVVWVKRVR